MITSLTDSSGINQMNEEIKRYEMKGVAQLSAKVFYQKKGLRVTLYSVQKDGKIVHERIQAYENGRELDYCSVRRQGRKGVVCF